mmetsp:Transcript_40479/g.125031  ORF Transcript_40479/g.125031 Transcript_40479/m.125031 type:complete len:264 (+) Transcript_40479:392-1183(+)
MRALSTETSRRRKSEPCGSMPPMPSRCSFWSTCDTILTMPSRECTGTMSTWHVQSPVTLTSATCGVAASTAVRSSAMVCRWMSSPVLPPLDSNLPVGETSMVISGDVLTTDFTSCGRTSVPPAITVCSVQLATSAVVSRVHSASSASTTSTMSAWNCCSSCSIGAVTLTLSRGASTTYLRLDRAHFARTSASSTRASHCPQYGLLVHTVALTAAVISSCSVAIVPSLTHSCTISPCLPMTVASTLGRLRRTDVPARDMPPVAH